MKGIMEIQEIKESGTDIVKDIPEWQKELENDAKSIVETEDSTGSSCGQFFSKAGGVLRFNDEPIPNNEIVVVILDSIIEHSLYTTRYDPKNPVSPSCYAFGRNYEDMVPHKDAENPQNESCLNCPHNQWGSADTGRGKNCDNSRRLALIHAGHMDKNGGVVQEDIESLEFGEAAYLKLPVTSVKLYTQYVKSCFALYKRPPYGLITAIKLSPEKSYFKVTFKCLGLIHDNLMPVIINRHKAIKEMIQFPYQKIIATQEPHKEPITRKY